MSEQRTPRVRHRHFDFTLDSRQIAVLEKIAWARQAFDYSPSIRAFRVAEGLQRIGLIRAYHLLNCGWQLTPLAYEYLESLGKFYRPPRSKSYHAWLVE